MTTVYETIDVSTNPAQENRRSATDIESEEDKTKPFSYFAVYCLLNIPENAEEYYLDAYLTVSNGTKTKTSDVGSLNVVNQSKHLKYSLGDEEKYICEINDSVGTCTFIESDELEGTNRFNKKDCTLGSDNNFVIHCYIFNNTILSYTATTYGYDDIRESDSFERGENGEIASIHDGGTYVITLTNSYKIQIKKLYFFEGNSSWWDNGEDTIAELIKYGDEGTLITGGYLHFDSYDGEDLIYVGYVEDDSIYNQIRFRIGDQSTEFVYTPYTGLPYYIQADEDWG